jgi:hypothetical protein
MESILVDLRVAMDSLMMEHMHHPAAPIATTPGVHLSSPVPLNSSESEAVPEETFYTSVLEQAHEKSDEKEEGATADAVLESFAETTAPAVPERPTVTNGKSLDSMTRQELATLAESRGIRVKRSMNRGEVLSLLRSMNPAQNEVLPTGAENVSGSAGGTEQIGASLDGSLPVDMEQGESLEQ